MMGQIRSIHDTEWPELRRLRLAMLRDNPEAYNSSLSGALRLDDAHWREWAQRGSCGADHLVAVVDCGAAGLVGVISATVRPDGDSTSFGALWVMPESRRAGLARRLVRHVVKWSRRRGVQTVTLWVSHRNTSAIALYRSLGFEFTGNWRPTPNGSEKEMALRLNEADHPVQLSLDFASAA
jgi:ribosomal protein S18 acetylase RimI-like enzyme